MTITDLIAEATTAVDHAKQADALARDAARAAEIRGGFDSINAAREVYAATTRNLRGAIRLRSNLISIANAAASI